MAGAASNCFLLFLLLLLSISGRLAEEFASMAQLQAGRGEKKRKNYLQISQHDTANPSTTIFPGTPAFPQPTAASTPTIVTVPTINPVTVVPTSPWGVPGTPVAVSGGRPISTTVTTYPTTPTNPVSSPAVSSPVFPGQIWCVAKTGTLQTLLQAALDYACGIGGSDCSPIQQGGNCFFPNTLENHASFAFNSYFQRIPIATSCNFGGTAMIVNTNPSTGSCIYPPSPLPGNTNPVPTPTPSALFPPSPLTISPPYPLTPSPPYPITTLPPYPVTTSPPYPVITTPPYPVPLSPPYPATASPPYPVTESPPYPVTTSPPYPVTLSPPYPLSPPSSSSGTSPTPTVLNTSDPTTGSGTTTTTGFGSESPASPTSSATSSTDGGFTIITVLLLVITFESKLS